MGDLENEIYKKNCVIQISSSKKSTTKTISRKSGYYQRKEFCK